MKLQKPLSQKAIGRLLVLGAALLWSLSGLFAKAPIFDSWDESIRGPLLAFWRALFAGIVLLPLVRRPRWRPSLIFLVLFFVGMNITYLTAMVKTTAANAIWLQYTAPFWVLLFAPLILHERIQKREWIPLSFAVVGVITILFFEIRGQALGDVSWGLAAGLGYAGVVVFMRQLKGENSMWLVSLIHLMAAIALVPWVFFIDTWPSPYQLVVLLAFGVLQMGIPYFLLSQGLRYITGTEAAIITLVEPILMPLWVYLAWGEIPAWWTLLGALLILCGLLFRYVVWEFFLNPQRRRKTAH